jgi:hypothetical protein
MVRGWLLAVFAALGACHADPPRDCSVVDSQARQCISEFGSGDDREMLLACFPFSKPENIEGAWYFGFELNAFYEDMPAPTVYRDPPGPADTSLEYDPHLPNDGNVRVLQMQVIGRRSQCPMGLPEHIILVDRVIASSVKAVAG